LWTLFSSIRHILWSHVHWQGYCQGIHPGKELLFLLCCLMWLRIDLVHHFVVLEREYWLAFAKIKITQPAIAPNGKWLFGATKDQILFSQGMMNKCKMKRGFYLPMGCFSFGPPLKYRRPIWSTFEIFKNLLTFRIELIFTVLEWWRCWRIVFVGVDCMEWFHCVNDPVLSPVNYTIAGCE
jgi:hypothetical protein